jgi:hypothetical protein
VTEPLSGPMSSGRQADDLARDLARMVVTIDQARAVGLSVAVPDALYRACLEVIARYQDPSGSRGADGRPSARSTGLNRQRRSASVEGPSALDGSSGQAAPGSPLDDVPLRRVIWQVIDPGAEFTVADVVQRLALLGVSVPANKVSNALGYWASRNRLYRERKGTYRYPATIVRPTELEPVDSRQVVTAEDREKCPREQEDAGHVESLQRQAM